MIRRPSRRVLVGVVAALAMTVLTPTTAYAVLFSDGFETGDLSNWTASSNFTVQSSLVFAGGFAGRATNTGPATYVYKDVGSQTNVYFKAMINHVSATGPTVVLRFRQTGGNQIASLNINKSGALVRKNHVTSTQDKTSATTVPKGVWHEIQMHAQINGTSSVYEVWFDGALVADISGTVSLGTNPIGRVQLDEQGSSTSSHDTAFDEVVADTAFISGGGGTAPATPTNLRATNVTASEVDLAWDASAGATGYHVYRDGNPTPLATVTAPSTTYGDTTVVPSTQYSYAVDAFNGSGNSAQTAPLVVTTPPPSGGDPVIAAAGDIACDPADVNFNNGNGTSTRCRMQFTANLLTGADRVLALGDTQYECGGTAAYNQSYDPTWGAFKAITYPAVGDNEYITSGTDCGAAGADGYFAYFGAVANGPNGWYSFDFGGWRFIALNSECAKIGGCSEGTPQNNFLEQALNNGPMCTLAYFHKPRFASKKNGSQILGSMKPFWDDLYAAGADIVLNGHSHFYERHLPQDPDGRIDNADGIVEWIVGTGGKSHGGLADPGLRLPTSATGTKNEFGVLKLTLHPTGYDWDYDVEGASSFSDTGSGSCH
jgi:chitodextrinase